MNPSLRQSVFLLGAGLALAGNVLAQAPQVLVFDGGHDDRARAAATDASGAAFIAGSSTLDGGPVTALVLKYNAAGTLQWQARPAGLGEYNAKSIGTAATDAAGNVYVAGYAAKELPFFQWELGWTVTSFAPNGAQRWVSLYNAPDRSADVAYAAALHEGQGLYVTGITGDAFGRADWLTIRYSLAGAELWRRVEPGRGNTDDQPVTVATDAAGNAIVLGYVASANDVGSAKDARLIKYDPQGNVLWRADYSFDAISDEFPSGLVVDASGNIYVSIDRGVSTNPELGNVPTLVKYDANGTRLWVIDGPGRGGGPIALDAAGNVVTSGMSLGENGTNLVAQTSKISPAGAVLWSQPIGAAFLSVDAVTGNIFAVRANTFTVLKLNAAGQVLWEQNVAQGQRVYDALVDPATGDFIATGESPAGFTNMLTARFSAIAQPPPPAGPAAPSALSASAKKGSISLAWIDNANNETGFRVERAVNGGAFTQIAQLGTNVRAYTDASTSKNVSYAYRVRSFNANGNSAYSNTASATGR